MNILAPWNIVFFIGFILYLSIRHKFARATKNNENVASKIDVVEKILLISVAIGNLLIPVIYLFTSLFAFADYHLPTFAPWFGIAIMITALWLFWRSHSDLGINWSVSLELHKDQELIQNGVYRLIRHPMYAAIWLWGIAQILLLSNWIAGWAAFVTFAPLYFLRVPKEEKMMCEFFGKEYKNYIQKTGRIFPR